ncbi:MAG: TSUP family transporter [Pseudomonadota bacterium]
MTALQTVLFLLCVVVATCAQNLSGFAFALIMLSLAGLLDLAPLSDLVNVATVLALINGVIALRASSKTMDGPAFRNLTLGSVAGIAAGVLLLGWLSVNVALLLRLLLGITVGACAIVVLRKTAAVHVRSSVNAFRAWGLLSGLLTGLFATGGPPLVYHLYRQPMALKTVRDTLLATLAASASMRLVIVLVAGHFSLNSLKMCLMATPLVLVLSWWLEKNPPGWSRPAVLKLVCALLLLTSAGLVLPSLTAMYRLAA